ncbi:MAG: peptide chain release factor N(5)-glutamine methyltransferase [Alteripontixanthobacter sp.]
MRIAAALRSAAAALSQASETARLDAELLMAHALGISRSDLLLRHLQDEVPAGFAELLARRLRSEPVAYITGFQEFYGRSFFVTPEVLIPRGDSETIVDAALPLASGDARILDCGTGSGALLLTVLADRPEASGVGIDASLGALAVAAANAARLGLANRTRMLRRDWREPDWRSDLGYFDLLIANPPYVETNARLARDVIGWEPGSALFAGADGLDDYRILVPQLADLLAPGGAAVLEIGAGQADSVESIARLAGFSCHRHRDLGGHERALVLKRNA